MLTLLKKLNKTKGPEHHMKHLDKFISFS